MRSHRRTICTSALAALLLSMCLGMSGCQIGRTFFQMSSDSPVPFFGMDLLPERKKSSPTDGVSRFQNETVSETSEPTVDREVQTQTASARSWGNLLGRSPKTEPLVLPTSASSEIRDRPSDAPVEQFR